MRQRVVAGMALTVPLAVALLAGCTSTVAGTAQPDPERVTVAPPASTDPCSLLTSDEAAQLKLQTPGVPQPEDKASRIPQGCNFKAAGNPDSELDGSLTIFYSTDLNVREYFSSAPVGQEMYGGVTWDHYPSFIGDSLCDLAVSVSDLSFIDLSSQNFTDGSKACDTARAAAAVVAKRIPR